MNITYPGRRKYMIVLYLMIKWLLLATNLTGWICIYGICYGLTNDMNKNMENIYTARALYMVGYALSISYNIYHSDIITYSL